MAKRLLTMVAVVCCGIAHDSAVGDEVDYLAQIKPILAAKCYACHGAVQQQGELRLETRALMLAGGDGGQVILPGNAHDSLLLERITASADERMPPTDEGAALSADEIALLRTWIDQGAKAPDEPVPADPREHWAFQRPLRPVVPQVPVAGWSRHPIDAFLAADHQRLGLVRLEPAEKHVLLRRVYLDLIGLPPTRAQLQAFLANDSPTALEQVVHRLLDHPGYGERWGRHWMDVWRYSDWYGLGAQVRYSQKHIWRWRDWIIQSLNEDKPYSRMIVEMLAGDEIAPTDPDTLRATGFLARNYFLFNRTTWLDTTVEHTSKALLGLTLNCARCHDHKYDPLSQTDYYQMRAVFEPHQVRVDPIPGEIDLDRNGLPRAFDNNVDLPTYVFVRGNAQDPDKSRVIQPGVPAVLASGQLQATPVELPLEAYSPGLQAFALADHLAAAAQQIETAQKAVADAQLQFAAAERGTSGASGEEEKPLSVATAQAMLTVAERTLAAAELRPAALRAAYAADVARARAASPEETTRLIRAAAHAARKYELARAEQAVSGADQELAAADQKKRAAAEKKLAAARAALEKARRGLSAPGERYTSLYVSRRAANGMVDEATPRHGPYSKVSTGRRTALARWIASEDNPLTARVAINHIWLRHFGQPLVESMTDFGLRTPRPRQHALLDWLAVEFMQHDWSMKHLHGLIVTSRAYQLNSSLLGADESTRRADPDNNYYWRRKPIRMESQVVRDSMLHLAGVLDPTIGGPTIDPGREDTVFRRSLYFTHSRDDRAKFMSMFDDADILRCYRRKESIVPQQALALANSKLALLMSRKIAARLCAQHDQANQRQFAVAAFESVLLTRPTAEEVAACCAAMTRTVDALKKRKHSDPDLRARENLVHALLNHNDFITIR